MSGAQWSPGRGFWREVPCGHPPDPLAALMPGGGYGCHCGARLDAKDALPQQFADPEFVPAGLCLVPCQKCGCTVGVPLPADALDAGRGE